MISMLMAAKNHVCAFPERFQSRDISILIRIQYERVSVALDLETGMSNPCYLHIIPLGLCAAFDSSADYQLLAGIF